MQSDNAKRYLVGFLLNTTDRDSKGYPFGIYFCLNCRTLIMWYPDTVKHPEIDLYPEHIECPTCKQLLEPTEKLYIKDIWTELVPTFLETTNKYPFSTALIIDESHVHFSWTRSQLNK
jgi:hypothetical protein